METITIDENDYYYTESVQKASPIYFKGCRNVRELIKKKDIDKDNFILSQKRADAIADILFAKGINRNRIIAVGYGSSKLTNECRDGILCLEEEHQANIRTEVKILGLIN